MGRLERNDLAVAMHDELGVDEAVLKAALDRHSLIFRDERSIFALMSGFDERAAASVLKNELVAEDLGHLALDFDCAPVSHGGNRDRRQRCIGGSSLAMPVSHREGANSDAEREDRDGCGRIDG